MIMHCGLLLMFLTLVSLAWAEDYYKVLGVPRDADEKQIKTAYRSLSKKYHPDKNPGDDTAQQKFIEIGEAYEVLMDKEKRSVYDRYGEEGLKNGGPGGPGGAGGHAGGDPFDMFSNFFGGGRRGGQRGGRPRGNNVDSAVDFTLKDFYNGKNSDFRITLQDICPQCKGTGSEDGKMHTCGQCRGRGRVIQKRQLAPGMFQQFEGPCPECNGSGKQIDHKCKKCHGDGVYRHTRKYDLHLAPGAPRNHVEVYHGEADKSPSFDAGDLRIVCREDSVGNLGYRRIGNNLYRTEPLSLNESIHGGWKREIPFLDEYAPTVTLSREAGQVVQSGEVETVKGKGMPLQGSEDEHGDLYIEYVVIYPAGAPGNLHDEL